MKWDVERHCGRYVTCRPADRKCSPMAFTPCCQYLVHLRLLFRWILYYGYLGLNKGKTQFLWLWIDFVRSHILFHATRQMMLSMSPTYSLERLWGCVICPGQLFLIGMLTVLSYFWKALWAKLGPKLLFWTTYYLSPSNYIYSITSYH